MVVVAVYSTPIICATSALGHISGLYPRLLLKIFITCKCPYRACCVILSVKCLTVPYPCLLIRPHYLDICIICRNTNVPVAQSRRRSITGTYPAWMVALTAKVLMMLSISHHIIKPSNLYIPSVPTNRSTLSTPLCYR